MAHSINLRPYFSGNAKLFLKLAPQGLLEAFAPIYFAARKFPLHAVSVRVMALRDQYFFLTNDDGGGDGNRLLSEHGRKA